MKTLQEQYNLIKEGKGHKDVFLKEAKRLFPNIVPNSATFNQTSKLLKQRSVISENIFPLMPSSGLNPFSTFDKFVNEEAKATEKKTTKEVEKAEIAGYDYKDPKNLDNQIFDQYLNGVRVELEKDPKLDLTGAREKVAKNLEKDPLFYMKNAAFGVEGIGYEELKNQEEPKGKYKSSGYGEIKENKKLKENESHSLDGLKKAKCGTIIMVGTDKYVKDCTPGAGIDMGLYMGREPKEYWWKKNEEDDLVHSNELAKLIAKNKELKENNMSKSTDLKQLLEEAVAGIPSIGNPFLDRKKENYESKFESFLAEEEKKKEMKEADTDAKRADDAKRLGKKGEENIFGAGVEKGEEVEKAKMKKEGRMKMSEVLKEAERLGEIAKKKVEAKVYERAIAERKKAMSVNEDESLSEFINQEAIKEVEKEVKELEKKLMEASADKNTMTGGR